MTDRAAAALWRMAIVTVLLGAFLRQTLQQWGTIQEGTQAFLIGDWLISYAGGFVRRGFFGWLLGLLAPDAADGLLLLFGVQTTLYAVIFGIAIVWALRLPSPARWAPLLLSPAFLLFGFNDFGGSHRKEIILLAGLFVAAESVRSGRWTFASFVVATLLFAVGVLSHEANALLGAPFLLLLREAARAGLLTARNARRFALTLVAVAVVGLGASVFASGDAEQQRAACVDLVGRGFDPLLCAGAVSYLGQSVSEQVVRVGATLPMGLLYVIAAGFASVPFLLSPWAREHRRSLVLAVLPLAPLFVVAVDWGRWIMLATVMATVLTVVGSSREGSVPERVPAVLVLLFVNGWSLEHFNISVENLGQGKLLEAIVGFVPYVRSVLLG